MPKSTFGVVFSFLVALVATLMVPSFFSRVEISFLIAPVVISFYFVSSTTAAWLAFGAGCLLDCLHVLPRLGFLGSAYLGAALIVYPWRLFFFKESLSTLPIMTYLFSFFTTLIQPLLALFFDLPSFTFSLHWFFTDCLIMPLVDAAYACLFFSLPYLLYTHYYRKSSARRWG